MGLPTSVNKYMIDRMAHGRHDATGRRFADTFANNLILYCFKDTAAH